MWPPVNEFVNEITICMKTEEKRDLGNEILEQTKGSVNVIFRMWGFNISSGTSEMSKIQDLDEKRK